VRAQHWALDVRFSTATMSITYLEAIREAQASGTARRPRVFIYGQDIALSAARSRPRKIWRRNFPVA